MKTKEEIKEKILELQDEIVSINLERDYHMERYQGLTKEQNEDYHHDITCKVNQIKTLQWVLGIKENKTI